MSTQSRRGFLAAVSGALAAGAAVADAATGTSPRVPAPTAAGAPVSAFHVDPVVALCEQIAALNREQEHAEATRDAIECDFTLRHGPRCNRMPLPAWADDPAWAEFRGLGNRSDSINTELGKLFAELIPMPATSAAGALAKLRIASGPYVWPEHLELDWHHEVTLALIRDAERALS